MQGQEDGLGSALWLSLRDEVEQTILGVMKTVEQAPDGQWIDASEEQVRDLFGTLRQRVYQQALQIRMSAVEADFSPSKELEDGGSPPSQGQDSVQRVDV